MTDDKGKEGLPRIHIFHASDGAVQLCNEKSVGARKFVPVERLRAVEAERDRLLDNTNTWPLPDVLAKLADAADSLLTRYNYDGHGWEEVQRCRDRARELVAMLRASPSSQPTAQGREGARCEHEAELFDHFVQCEKQAGHTGPHRLKSPLTFAQILEAASESPEPEQPAEVHGANSIE